MTARKIRLSPGKMQAFRLLPTPLVGWILRFVFQSSFGDRFMYRHSMKAPDEMRQLYEQHYYPEAAHVMEGRKYGFNIVSQLLKLFVIFPTVSALAAWICTLF